MTEPNAGQRRHFHLQQTGQPERFQSTASPTREPRFPRRDRKEHGAALRTQLGRVQEQMTEAVRLQKEWGQESGLGLQIEFVSEPGFELAFEGLARGPQRIELLNVRHDVPTQTYFATVFIPDGKLGAFESLVRQYLDATTKKASPAILPSLIPFRRSVLLHSVHSGPMILGRCPPLARLSGGSSGCPFATISLLSWSAFALLPRRSTSIFHNTL